MFRLLLTQYYSRWFSTYTLNTSEVEDDTYASFYSLKHSTDV